MRKYIFILFSFWVACHTVSLHGQELRNPFDFPILLSGNFGELRPNHFHSGIDFKTQGVEGKPIYAVEEGYVSRISVNPGGYGKALYINHPNGLTTVYGHLQRFTTEIETYIREQQYLKEAFSVNLIPEPGAFPVKKNDFIALSGNTGSSGGPHLHFEVRETETEEALDPIPYYGKRINDSQPPLIQGIIVYPMEGEGVVNGSSKKKEYKLQSTAKTPQRLPQPIEAWGKIGIAVKAYDKMNNTSNIYGVKIISLTVDSQLVFNSHLDHFAFAESRYINSYIDYEEWVENRSFYIKSFVEPGNRLHFLKSTERGIISIDEERSYQIAYTLADAFGNTSRFAFQIIGKKQPVPAIDSTKVEHFHWTGINRFGSKGVRLLIPHGNLYKDLYFRYTVKEDSTALAATHQIHDTPLAFHATAQLSIRLQHDTLAHKRQYGVVRVQNGRRSWIGGEYREGWIDANIRETGYYTVMQDTLAPTITPVNPNSWMSGKQISLRLSDNLSGVLTYRGEIDGQYALFEMNNRSVVSYAFDRERLKPGKHQLKLTATDACGNEMVYTYSFQW